MCFPTSFQFTLTLNEVREGTLQVTEYNIKIKEVKKKLRELEVSLLLYQQKTPFYNNHVSISLSEDQRWAYMKNTILIFNLLRYRLMH